MDYIDKKKNQRHGGVLSKGRDVFFYNSGLEIEWHFCMMSAECLPKRVDLKRLV